MSVTSLSKIRDVVRIALWAAGAAFGALLAPMVASPAAAQTLNCSVTADAIHFGTALDVSSSIPTQVNAKATVNCSGPANTTVRACLDLGLGSGGATPDLSVRYMRQSNNDALSFNLYRDSGRTDVWGINGQALEIVGTLGSNGQLSAWAYYYSRLPGGQSQASVGSYSTSLGGNSSMRYGPAATFPSCAGGGAAVAALSFVVDATVTPYCSVTGAALEFGSITNLAQVVKASTTFSSTCTKGAGYRVYMNGGLGNASDPTQRRMTAGDFSIRYGLYRDANCAQPWGWTKDVDTQSGVGTGASTSLTVHGCIPAGQPTPASGRYTDIVQITLEF